VTPLVNGITVLSATRQRWPLRFHPNQADWYSIYRPRKDERLSWPSWLVTYRDGLPVYRRSLIPVLTTLIEANALPLSQTANQSKNCAVARCLSVTRRYYIKTAKHIIKRFSPLDSCKILVLRTKRYGNTWTRTIQDTVINLLGRPTLVHFLLFLTLSAWGCCTLNL